MQGCLITLEMDRLIGLLTSAVTPYDLKWAALLRAAILPPIFYVRRSTGAE